LYSQSTAYPTSGNIFKSSKKLEAKARPKVARFLMGSKDAPQKMQFIGEIKKVASLGTFIQKWWINRTDSAVTAPK